MRTPLHTLLLPLCALILISCGGRQTTKSEFDGELYSPGYANGFTIYKSGEHSSVLEVRNPWQGAENVSTQMYISQNGEKAPEGFGGITIQAPLKSVVCLSASYIAFIDALGEIDAVKGVSGARYISNPVIRERYAKGEVREIGYDANINYEVLASLKPDLVLIFGVGSENTAVTNKLGELGIKTMYIADYLEETPLGKSEWIVAFGEMFGKREMAESIFNEIASDYEQLKQEASKLDSSPKVMLNAPYKDIWFVPGDRSYIVRLINDAGGVYVCAGEDDSVSRPISGEAAWVAASEADVWINPNQALTLADVKSQNPKFSDIKAVRNGRVYNATKRRTESGGSDFWESGSLYADRVLKDMIICLHPDWQGGSQQTYYIEQLR